MRQTLWHLTLQKRWLKKETASKVHVETIFLKKNTVCFPLWINQLGLFQWVCKKGGHILHSYVKKIIANVKVGNMYHSLWADLHIPGPSEATEKWGVKAQNSAEICLLLTTFVLFSAKVGGAIDTPAF